VRDTLVSILFVLGGLTVAAGAALASPALGVAVLGLFLVLLAFVVSAGYQRRRP
jgi:uncharacterized membrane protein YjgN (DUF898 family)